MMSKRTKIERGGDARIRKRVKRRGSTSIRVIVVIRNVLDVRGLVLRRLMMDTLLIPRQRRIPRKILEGDVVMLEKMMVKNLLAVVMMMMTMIGTTHQIEGGIDMMTVVTAGREAKVEKDEGEKGAQRDIMMIMIGMKDNLNVVQLVGEGGRGAEVTAWIEKTQGERGVLEERIIEITKVVIVGAVDERMIGINTMIGSSLRETLQHPKATPVPRRKDMD
mmetsp:Transcript_34759/g.70965  ORF Transcript_34759/g.70965 Transcript_34759/m.70965 type:complete len:220 (+) Transcript_34759:798-1457(+)